MKELEQIKKCREKKGPLESAIICILAWTLVEISDVHGDGSSVAS